MKLNFFDEGSTLYRLHPRNCIATIIINMSRKSLLFRIEFWRECQQAEASEIGQSKHTVVDDPCKVRIDVQPVDQRPDRNRRYHVDDAVDQHHPEQALLVRCARFEGESSVNVVRLHRSNAERDEPSKHLWVHIEWIPKIEQIVEDEEED